MKNNEFENVGNETSEFIAKAIIISVITLIHILIPVLFFIFLIRLFN